MGVTGLWRLIEPAGKPVPVETLENKVLAVDISIWLHQVVKGYQDAKGAPLPNAHLMGLFQRLCKLLYFRIKPVFVFDGGFPDLKKETIAKRQDNKSKYNSESERIKREIALLLSKKTAIGSLLGKQISPKKNKNNAQDNTEDLFKLPALPQKDEETESESEDEQNSSASTVDLHTLDIESEDFKNMPVKEKYDLLVELKETRKMNSWGKLHTLPKKSENFSDFQMQRLLKRRKVQECLAETEKEMGDSGMSLNELESLLNEEGIDTKIETLPTRRIASDNTTRYLLINNVKQALADAKKREETENSKDNKEVDLEKIDDPEDDLQKAIKMSLEIDEESCKTDEKDKDVNSNKKDELEDDLQKAIKMSLECVEEPNAGACTSKTDDSWTSLMTDSDYTDIGSDSEEDDGYAQPDFSSAKAYIMQYSDFTHKAIDNIVAPKNKDNRNKTKGINVEDVLEEINNEKSIITDKVDLSSGDEVSTQKVPTEKPLLSIKQEENFRNDPCTSDTMLGNEKQIDPCKVIHSSSIDLDMTQSSVVCYEKPCDDIITLDSTSEEITDMKETPPQSNNLVTEDQSDSSEGEFEEVSDPESKVKHVVEVTLNPGEVLEDDIFADCFVKSIHDHSNENIANSEMLNSSNETLVVKKEDKNKEEKKLENKVMQENVQNVIQKPEPSLIEKVKKDSSQIKLNSSIANDTLPNEKLDTRETNKATQQPPKNVISTEKLTSMVTEIENEEQNLLQEKGRMERIGRNITEQMTREAQELLQIFGIPYIVAPMEAEAQCAFLESVKLTDGTITDDSDIWLFGGKTVYKNFFNQKKHVLQFLSERIEKSFNLSREQLILLALLVGSDYTTGVTGVGPVTALEILASFPFNKRQFLNEASKHSQYQQVITGLQEFKKWVRAGKRTDNISLKKKLRNVSLSEDFPSVRVVQAYLEPNVEKSEDKFTWGELDITVLRDYAKAKFGWSQNKLDVIVQPVLKRMLERKTQKTVHDYFKRKVDVESLEDQMSKRVKAAVQKMDPERSNTETEQVAEDNKTAKRRKPGKGTKSNNDPSTAGPSKSKKKKVVENVVKVCTTTETGFEINIPKTDRYQEFIPQREKDKQNILQNKLKAIEVFRKKTIDQKKKRVKRRVILPKDEAYLSESSDSN